MGKKAGASLTSEEVKAQTEAFLKAGGKVDRITNSLRNANMSDTPPMTRKDAIAHRKKMDTKMIERDKERREERAAGE